ncbi:hypothetical protein CDD83_3226 [Cordyceps sp. RAO-2017]|nr:hypothetical protein CDD83_3226 [Cordyceps sp. RAO-2017]
MEGLELRESLGSHDVVVVLLGLLRGRPPSKKGPSSDSLARLESSPWRPGELHWRSSASSPALDPLLPAYWVAPSSDEFPGDRQDDGLSSMDEVGRVAAAVDDKCAKNKVQESSGDAAGGRPAKRTTDGGIDNRRCWAGCAGPIDWAGRPRETRPRRPASCRGRIPPPTDKQSKARERHIWTEPARTHTQDDRSRLGSGTRGVVAHAPTYIHTDRLQYTGIQHTYILG